MRRLVETSELVRLYFDKAMTLKEVAKEVGLKQPATIRNRLIANGYALRQHRRAQFVDPEQSPTIHPTRDDIVYAAGFYDGDGSCAGRTKHGKKSNGVSVSITQKDRKVCEWFCARFGGSIGISAKVTWGRKEPTTYYVWRIGGPRAHGFLLTIFTKLSQRRKEQIKAALSRVTPDVSHTESTTSTSDVAYAQAA